MEPLEHQSGGIADAAAFVPLILVVAANIGVFIGVLDPRAGGFHISVNAVLAPLIDDLETDGMKPADQPVPGVERRRKKAS